MRRLNALWLPVLAACGGQAWTRPGTSPGSNASALSPADQPVTVSYRAGGFDPNGNFLGGTELINLVAFDGKLWAGNGYWEDVPGSDPQPGPQVLVLGSSQGAWTQDHAFSDKDATGQLRFGRLTALAVLTFTVDASGFPLDPPVSILAVGLEHQSAAEPGSIFTRNDEGSWTELVIPNVPAALSFRALTVHHEAISGQDLFFAGGGNGNLDLPGGIFVGAYDDTAPGRIRMQDAAEFTGFTKRVMAFAEANGQLFFTAKPSLYGRTDGSLPSWADFDDVPPNPDANATRDNHNAGLRGLTAIAQPGGLAGQVLLAGLEGVDGPIVRIDPDTRAVTAEVALGEFVAANCGQTTGDGTAKYVLSAYNDMPLVQHPDSGDWIRFIGMQAYCDAPGKQTSAFFAVRDPTGRPQWPAYTLHQVAPIGALQSPYGLVAIRTLVVSPFPEDQGQVLFLGGYDADFRPAHNSAWMYRVGLRTALAL